MANAENLTVQACMRDHAFQDWLAEKGVMTRRSSLNLNTAESTGHRKPVIMESFLSTLSGSEGYIVPMDDLAESVYGSPEASESSTFRGLVTRTRESLNEPDQLFRADGVGCAVGVSEFRLTKGEVPLLYRLWREMYNFVNYDELILSTQGFLDDSSRNSVAQTLRKLKATLLEHTDLRIDWRRGRRGEANPQVRLTDAETQELFAIDVEDELPRHLDMSFQNWLASKGVGVLIRSKVPDLETMLQGELSPYQEKILRVLTAYTGRIVPFEYFSEVFYGDKTDSNKLKVIAVLKNLRAKLGDTAINAFDNLGIALGVSELRLSEQRIKALYALWAAKDNTISAEDLSLYLYGTVNLSGLRNADNVIYRIRDVLRGSQYTIDIVREDGGENHKYILRRI